MGSEEENESEFIMSTADELKELNVNQLQGHLDSTRCIPLIKRIFKPTQKITNQSTELNLTNHKQEFFNPSLFCRITKYIKTGFDLFTFCERYFLTVQEDKKF